MEVTIDKINSKTIDTKNGTFHKYGIQTTKGGDRWINIVDWERKHDKNGLSTGDTIKITEPEKDQYGWNADFIEEPQGFDDEDVDNFQIERLLNGVKENRELILRVLQEMDVQVTTKQGDIDYPEPTKGQTPEEVNAKFAGKAQEKKEEATGEMEDSIDDINW